MFKVTFLFLNQVKVLYCQKVEEAPWMFVTLSEILRNPEEKGGHPLLNPVTDSYPEFKNRKMLRVPITAILLIEGFEHKALKIVGEDNNLYEL